MDVVLLFSQTGPKKTVWAPLSLLYLATALRDSGFSPQIIDTRVDKDYATTLRTLTRKESIFGISVMIGHQIVHGLRLSRFIKHLNPRSRVIWGGVFPTLCPEACLQSGAVDIVVRGEGEATLPELVRCLEDNGSLDTVTGIAYRDPRVRINPDRPLIDMDKLPFPAWDLVDATRYFRNDFADRILPIQTSRGCPNRCSFCYTVPVWKGTWRSVKPERVLTEIQMLVDEYHVNGVNFCEDNFFVDLDRIKTICEKLIRAKLGVCWSTDCNVDVLANMRDADLSLLRDSGCKSLYLGADSGSTDTLKRLEKNTTPRQAVEAVKKCGQYDIIPIVSLLIGLPNDSYETVRETIDFADELRRTNPNTLVTGLKLITPYPETKLYEEYRVEGLKEPETLEDWSGFVPTNPMIRHHDSKFAQFLQVLAYISWFALGGAFIRDNVPTSFAYTVAEKTLTALARLRWKHRFWKFPIEWRLVAWYDKYCGDNIGKELDLTL